MSRIESIGTALPKNVVTQADARATCEKVYAGDARLQRLLRVFDSGVETRHFAFPPDYYLTRRSFEERNAAYVEQGTILAEAAARECLDRAGVSADAVDHIFFVTTTGLATPSVDALLAPRLGLRKDARRWPLFGLGCAAGAGGLIRAGEQALQQGTARATMGYSAGGQPTTVACTGAGPLSGLTLTSGYDTYQFQLRTSLSLNTSPSAVSFTYGYDTASRLQTVTDTTSSPHGSATYSYLDNSPLIWKTVFQQGSTTRMTTTKQYDFLNRLTSISSVGTGSTPLAASYAYQYNSANQRTRAALADGSYWVYAYDSLGQVISGHKFFADGTPMPGQLFDYGFDTIGNRTLTKTGGDQNGQNQRLAGYTANNLNQYVSRDVPGAVDVMGIALASDTVTVNTSFSPWRKNEYFRQQLTVANSSVPVWQQVDVDATSETRVTRPHPTLLAAALVEALPATSVPPLSSCPSSSPTRPRSPSTASPARGRWPPTQESWRPCWAATTKPKATCGERW